MIAKHLIDEKLLSNFIFYKITDRSDRCQRWGRPKGGLNFTLEPSHIEIH